MQLGAAQVIEKSGGRGRDRTGGPLLAKALLLHPCIWNQQHTFGVILVIRVDLGCFGEL